MNVLCLNCGGATMKYQLLSMPSEKVLVKGGIDRLFSPQAELKHWVKVKEDKYIQQPLPGATFAEGISWLLNNLQQEGIIEEVEDLDAIVHKLAHGGESFKEPTEITEEVLTTIKSLYNLAPVHLPPAVEGIEVCAKLLPNIPQYAVFETYFHQTVPSYAYMYGIPYEWYEKYGIRKYGFHSVSHSYVTVESDKILGRSSKDLKIVSCHLGSGTSVAAIKGGVSVDISSGLTPQSGTIMSTRPGDFDPWVILAMMDRLGLSTKEINDILIKEGGLRGISGVSGDMRDLEKAAQEGNSRANLAIEVFCYQVKKYIGAFAAVMNGLDALVFTGGIGEKSPEIRAKICKDLDYLSVYLDPEKNQRNNQAIISDKNSRVAILVIEANEELMIARQVYNLRENKTAQEKIRQ